MTEVISDKKKNVIEQVAKMRAAKMTDMEIQGKLIDAGLTKVQVNEVCPYPKEEPKGFGVSILDDEDKKATIEGAIQFMDYAAGQLGKTFTHFPELNTVRTDMLTWARKLKKAL